MALLAAGAALTTLAWQRGVEGGCGCFGSVIAGSQSGHAEEIARNGLIAAIALVVVLVRPGGR